MRNRRSVRFRLTLWYLAVLAGGMFLFGTGSWIVLRVVLRHNSERDLDQLLSAMEQFISRESRGNDLAAIQEETREYATGLPEGEGLRVWTSSGELLFGREAAQGPVLSRRRVFTVHGHKLEAELSTPLEEYYRTLSVLGWVMLSLAPIVLGIAAAGGWWLARRALFPVDEMTQHARSINAKDLTMRLAVPETGDELERLAEAWNELLSRIENSVRTVSRFSADAAHELRTPVAVIRTSAELALRQERTPERYRQTLESIQRETEQITEVLEHLLLLARGDAGQWQFRLEPLSVGDALKRLREVVEPLAEARQIRLDWDLSSEPAVALADESALRRLVLILADNALKFTPPGGRVLVRFETSSHQCVLELEDTGCGISPEDLPHVFDRFYRSDAARAAGSGAGLGLAIARAIVEAHDGTILASSAAGGGTTFRVVLPSVLSLSEVVSV